MWAHKGVVWNASLVPGSFRWWMTRQWLHPHSRDTIVKVNFWPNSNLKSSAWRFACFNRPEVFSRSSGRVSRRCQLCFLCSGSAVRNSWWCRRKVKLCGALTHSMHTSTVTIWNLVMWPICAPVLGKLLSSSLKGEFVFSVVVVVVI